MTLAELAARLGAEVRGETATQVEGVAALADAGPGEVSFYANPRYRDALESTGAGAVLVDAATADSLPAGGPALLVCGNPYAAYARVLALFHPEVPAPSGVHPTAVVAADAEIDPSASVGALCFVGAGARLGPGVVLHPQAHVGAGASLEEGCVVLPRAYVGERCVLGRRVRVHPAAVIGSDGFGYALDQDEEGPFHRKVPQVGIVVLEDDVEVGAGACIDRATTGETRIGRGTKIDNLVQIGHNVSVGPLSILCGQAGIAGSTTLGAGVVLAGQVGLAGHLTVGDGARIGAASGVHGDVPAGETWTGYPALPHRLWLRAMVALKELPQLVRRVRALEKRRPSPSEGGREGDASS